MNSYLHATGKALLLWLLILSGSSWHTACAGGLTQAEIREIYKKPWEYIQKLISGFLVLSGGDTLTEMRGFNHQVIASRINIPDTETVILLPYGRLSYFQYFRFLDDPRAKQIRGEDATIKFMVFVLYFNSDTYLIGIPKKLVSEGGVNEANTRMLYLTIATQGEADLSHFLRCSDSSGKRIVYDFHKMPSHKGGKDKLYLEFCENMTIELYRQLVSRIESSDGLLAKARKGITLICLGCGTGRELQAGHDALDNRFGPLRVFGLENSRKVIGMAREQYPDLPHDSLIEGDALEAGKYITDFLSSSPVGTQGLAVVVAFGLLSEVVLPGTYPAHQILQQVARTPVDLMLVTSYGSHLFNRQTALNAGWHTEIRAVPDHDIYKKQPVTERCPQLLSNRIYILTPAILDQQAKNAISKSQVRNRNPQEKFTTLDLSMTSRPEQLLPALLQAPECSDIKAVDISWSLLTPEQVQDLIRVMVFWGVQNMVYSGFEPWNQPAVSELLTSSPPLNIYHRIDSQYAEELPSVPYFLMKLFDPEVKITKPAHKKVTETAEHRKQEQKVSCLSGDIRQRYIKRLLKKLRQLNIQLQTTPRDGMCLYHALAQPLGESALFIQNQILVTAIGQYQYLVDELGFSEQVLQQAINTIYDGSWQDGNYSQIALAAIGLQKNILLIMPNASTGEIQYHLFTPDNNGNHYQTLPYDFDMNNALILVQDGNDHYLAGGISNLDSTQLDYINTQALVIAPMPGTGQQFSPGIFPASDRPLFDRLQPVITDSEKIAPLFWLALLTFSSRQ